jgi:hypothetical protein
MHGDVEGILRAIGQEGNQILQINSVRSVKTIRGHSNERTDPMQSASFRTGVKETMTRTAS